VSRILRVLLRLLCAAAPAAQFHAAGAIARAACERHSKLVNIVVVAKESR
jgi:hypothetical protein